MLKLLLQEIVTIIFVVVLFSGTVSAESARSLVESGNEAFAQGDYAASLERYEQADEAEPDSAIVLFNKGDALYKQEKYEEALHVFERSAAKARQNNERQLEAQSLYNMGNSAYRRAEGLGRENLAAALDEFKRSSLNYQSAVKLDPGFSEAAQNLEISRLAVKRVEELSRQQQHQAKQQKQQREDIAKQLEDLHREQQGAAESSRDLTRSQEQESAGRDAAQQAEDQKEITDRTRQAAGKLEQLSQEGKSGLSDEITREHVKRAIAKQEEAEKKLLRNKPGEAHDSQQEAARELQKALNQLGQWEIKEQKKNGGREEARNKAEPEGQEQQASAQDTAQQNGNVQPASGSRKGESPEDIVNEEIENGKFRGARNATGYKPVDKDW